MSKRDKNGIFKEKIQNIIKDVEDQWKNYALAQKILKDTTDEREKINNTYNYRVATYNLLATNTLFLDTILINNNSINNVNSNNIIELFFNKKVKKHIPKKSKLTTHCYKVNTDVLRARKKPSSNSKILHLYKRGETVCAIKQNFSWIETKHGWCFKDYLIRLEL